MWAVDLAFEILSFVVVSAVSCCFWLFAFLFVRTEQVVLRLEIQRQHSSHERTLRGLDTFLVANETLY